MKGISIMGWVVVAAVVAFLGSNPALVHNFEQYISGSYHAALKAPQHAMPAFVIRPKTGPTQNTKLTIDNTNKNLAFGNTQTPNASSGANNVASLGYGISINNK
jgi:hypothetical protein